MISTIRSLLLVAVTAIAISPAPSPNPERATTPNLLNYQGRLTTSSGNPVANGVYTIRFRLHTDSLTASFLWEETMPVQVTGGLFATILGASTSLPVDIFNSPNRWLGIRVNLDPELQPRRKLTTVPYAERVGTVDGAIGGTLSGTVKSNGGPGYGGHFTSTRSDTGGKALVGEYLGSNIIGSGVYGKSLPAEGIGIGGRFEGGFIGAYGIVNPTTPVTAFGLIGNVDYPDGSPAPSGATLYGAQLQAMDGYSNYGLRTVAYSSLPTCVSSPFNSTNYGVSAQSQGPTCNNYGVYGFASGAIGENIGVIGVGDKFGGQFIGDVQATGEVSMSAAAFKIDHPLDPDNKYLQHSLVESPDMMSIYNGNATTDDRGYAEIQLPEYFSALNQDFRYQLTPIGAFAQAIIAREIVNNSFLVQTDKPNIKISWQVTGIRHDVWANKHRIEVETLKSDSKRGTRLHPSEWGLNREVSEMWDKSQPPPVDTNIDSLGMSQNNR